MRWPVLARSRRITPDPDVRHLSIEHDILEHARAAAGIVQALAQAKEAGVDPDTAFKLVGWANG